MAIIIGAQHQFHDPKYSQAWTDRFTPTPEREELFSTIIDQLEITQLAHPRVLEIGVGPGYLAERVLSRLPGITYQGLDYSKAMIEIASKRIAEFTTRVELTEADLLDDVWIDTVRQPVGAIISTWTLHDLGGERQIMSVYRAVKSLLPNSGLFLNGDFVKPEVDIWNYEPGRLRIARHLELLSEAGLSRPECLAYLERETVHPTSSNNYACFQAWG